MISEDRVIDIIKHIEYYNYFEKKEKDTIDILISDEMDSVNYYEKEFKLIPIIKYDYDHKHYKINDNHYEVFIYKDSEIDSENMFQLIMCNNYIEIYNFKNRDYDNRIKICGLKTFTPIYSFFDNSIIIIKNTKYSDCEYETLMV